MHLKKRPVSDQYCKPGVNTADDNTQKHVFARVKRSQVDCAFDSVVADVRADGGMIGHPVEKPDIARGLYQNIHQGYPTNT